MNKRTINRLTNFAACLTGLLLLVIPTLSSYGQDRRPVVVNEIDKRRNPERPLTEIEEEMRAKLAIKYADKEYQDNLERARDLQGLVSTVATSFKLNSRLSNDDLKKLEKIEKLAKGIRRAAGGSEDDTEIEKPPANLASAIEMLGDLSQSLKAKVEKTPKHVISAAVIDEANVLLELLRLLRTMPPKV